MEEYLKDIGIMENNMEKGNSMILKKIFGKKEFGKMVKMLDFMSIIQIDKIL